MTEQEYQQAMAQGNVNFNAPTPQTLPVSPTPVPDDIDGFQTILSTIRRPKRHLVTAPTFSPKSLIDQIQFYDDGTNRRMYFYVNKVWRYATLT